MARNWKASLRTAAGRHSSRRGAFSAGLTALVIAAVIVYMIFVVVLRCITYADCMLLPKGEKIAKILHIKQKT